jgi:hypothetical protein
MRAFDYAILIEQGRAAIHVVRIVGAPPEASEIDDVMEKTRERMLAKHGEQHADVVVVQGSTKEDLRLFGVPVSVTRVRAALFNAALSWSPLTLD